MDDIDLNMKYVQTKLGFGISSIHIIYKIRRKIALKHDIDWNGPNMEKYLLPPT